ncbi:MAG: hypothetical protein KAS60_07575 [Thermoplasmata archaeon]|nr:hypothetical protein [Candidatus Thermoplasmatota archaeon]MCK4949930.1 hypothetical protein [Thermoplasmata archaeon]
MAKTGSHPGFPAFSERVDGIVMDKKIHLKIDKNDSSITLKDVLDKIQEIQEENPELEVFFDGDEYAVCSRPRREEVG